MKHAAWDLVGDGTVTAEGFRVVQTFEQAKVFSISMVATNDDGLRRLVTAEVSVGAGTHRDITLDDMDAETIRSLARRNP